MEKGRNNKIAAMGFVCACLVVMVHQGPAGDVITSGWWWRQIFSNGICGIANNFFFLVAGYFIARHVDEDGWWHREVWKRVRTLLVPMFAAVILLSLISLPLVVGANVVAHRNLLDNVGLIHGNLFSVFCLNVGDFPYFIPLWFIRALFGCVLLSWLLAWAIRMGGLIVPAVIIAFSLFSSYLLPWTKCLEGLFSIDGLGMFALGMCLQMRGIHYASKRIGALAIVVGGGILVYKLLVLSHRVVPAGPLIDFGTLVLLFGVWSFMPTSQTLVRLSAYSFPIYLLHWSVSYYGKFILGFIPMPEWLMLTVWAPITICGTVLLVFLFRKMMPRVASICFGGRG